MIQNKIAEEKAKEAADPFYKLQKQIKKTFALIVIYILLSVLFFLFFILPCWKIMVIINDWHTPTFEAFQKAVTKTKGVIKKR